MTHYHHGAWWVRYVWHQVGSKSPAVPLRWAYHQPISLYSNSGSAMNYGGGRSTRSKSCATNTLNASVFERLVRILATSQFVLTMSPMDSLSVSSFAQPHVR